MKGKKQMTAQDMQAAELLVRGESSDSAAEQLGMVGRTLRRRADQPHFKAYMEQLRTEKRKDIKKAAEKVDIVFTRNDAARRYLKVADDPKATRIEQIRATDSLVALYRLNDQPVVAPDPEGESVPAGPDVYRAAWMDRKPQ